MTLEEAEDCLTWHIPCEFFSSGKKGWVAWLDEGWHRGTIVEVDEQWPRIVLHVPDPYTHVHTIIVEVRGEEDMQNLLRIRCKD